MGSPILLELHTIQETPLPPYCSIAFVTLRTMFSLVGGELRKEVLLLMLSYFDNLVAFCLILKFLKFLFYSPLKKIKMREIEFLFFT